MQTQPPSEGSLRIRSNAPSSGAQTQFSLFFPNLRILLLLISSCFSVHRSLRPPSLLILVPVCLPWLPSFPTPCSGCSTLHPHLCLCPQLVPTLSLHLSRGFAEGYWFIPPGQFSHCHTPSQKPARIATPRGQAWCVVPSLPLPAPMHPCKPRENPTVLKRQVVCVSSCAWILMAAHPSMQGEKVSLGPLAFLSSCPQSWQMAENEFKKKVNPSQTRKVIIS